MTAFFAGVVLEIYSKSTVVFSFLPASKCAEIDGIEDRSDCDSHFATVWYLEIYTVLCCCNDFTDLQGSLSRYLFSGESIQDVGADGNQYPEEDCHSGYECPESVFGRAVIVLFCTGPFVSVRTSVFAGRRMHRLDDRGRMASACERC